LTVGCTAASIDWKSPDRVDLIGHGLRSASTDDLALIVPRFTGSFSPTSIRLLSIDGVAVNSYSPGLFGSAPEVLAVPPGERLVVFEAGRNAASVNRYTIKKTLTAGKRYEVGYDCPYGQGYSRVTSPGYSTWDKGKRTSYFPPSERLECAKPSVWIAELPAKQ
jgi:hypothetical protein